MTDILNNPQFTTEVKDLVRQVLRAELGDYLPTQVVQPGQIAPVDSSGVTQPAGYTLQISSDGIARFLP